jgi:Uncharacterized conserved protein
MKRLLFLFASLSLATLHASATDAPRGTMLELHSCELYAGGCTVSAEATQAGRYMVQVWNFTSGTFQNTDLKGLKVALLQSSNDNLAERTSKVGESVVYLPANASAAQQKALLAWIHSQRTSSASGKLHVRKEPMELTRDGTTWSFKAGRSISFQTKALEACDNRSCGEELWYAPRAQTSFFTVAVNRESKVTEPLLKLSWTDSAQRSVFIGRFGDSIPSGRETFVTMNEFCGASNLF